MSFFKYVLWVFNKYLLVKTKTKINGGRILKQESSFDHLGCGVSPTVDCDVENKLILRVLLTKGRRNWNHWNEIYETCKSYTHTVRIMQMHMYWQFLF